MSAAPSPELAPSAVGDFRVLRGPLLVSHRGTGFAWPENTLPAFEAALAAGADVLETDAHVTRDGEVVLAHDADGLRVARDPRAIAACSLAEVRGWNLARTGDEPVHVPTLAEVLERLPHAVWNVDLKAHSPAATDAVLRVIRARAAEDRVLLTSFSSAVTLRLRKLGYRGPIGLGQAEAIAAVFAPRGLLRWAPWKRARLQIPVQQGPLPLDRARLIAKLQVLGIPVDYWVVDDPVLAARLLERGASGLVTDDVPGIAAVLARSPRGAAWRERHPDRAG